VMANLLRELELASGPDRALDRAIATAAGWRRKNGQVGEDDYWKLGDWSWTREDNEHPPRYTASIDAALTLVPEGLTWQVTGRVREDGDYFADVDVSHRCDSAHNPAIALCIAALKVRDETRPKTDTERQNV